MKILVALKIIFATLAGLRLRCFLGPSQILLALLLCASLHANANVCVSPTLHVFRVHGHVSYQDGEKIPGAKILLKKAGNTVLESASGQEGNFQLNVPPGDYDLFVQAPGFARSWTPLKVGLGPKTLFRSNSLYVVLAIGTLTCLPNTTTSQREFKRQIRAFKARFGEPKQNHATQK